MKLPLILCSFGPVLVGCAQTPDVTYSYYPVTSKSTITLIQSIDCNTAGTQLFTVETPQVATSYTADLTAKPYNIPIRKLDGVFADSDFKLGLTEDGRLASVDQSTTGQGAAIAKAVISVVVSAAALGAGSQVKPFPLSACKTIASAGKGKPVTLTYTTITNLSAVGLNVSLPLYNLPSDPALYQSLTKNQALPALTVKLTQHQIQPASGVMTGDDVALTLQKMEGIDLEFRKLGQPFATAFAVVPTAGTYALPIPTAALFGKQSFSLSVAPSGAITSIEYGKTTGAADAANSLAAVLAAPSTAMADTAADAKGQADLIAQQQRLVRCKAKPATCS